MENNFEDKIKGLFENPPELEIDESGWNSITQQLDVASPQGGRISWMWMPIAIGMLSLAGLAGYFYSQYKMTNERLVEMEKKIEQINNPAPQIIYDTIIQKEFIQVSNSNISFNQNQKGSKKNIDPSKMESKNRSTKLFSLDKDENISNMEKSFSELDPFDIPSTPYTSTNPTLTNASQKVKETANSSSIDLLEKTNVKKESFAFLQGKSLNVVSSNQMSSQVLLSSFVFAALDLKRKKSRNNYLMTMRPQRFTLGMHTGTGVDLSLDLSELKQSNYVFGINGEIGFGSNWDLIIGGNYRVQNFEIEEIGNNQGIAILEGLPEVVPQDIDDELEEAKGQIRFLEIPIGFKYTFLQKKLIQPYLGLGFTSLKVLDSQMKYEFEKDNAQGSDEEYEIIKTDFLSSDFKIKDAWGKVGLQLNIFRKWRFFIEGSYQSNWKNDGTLILDDLKLLRANTGVNYKF